MLLTVLGNQAVKPASGCDEVLQIRGGTHSRTAAATGRATPIPTPGRRTYGC
jgi:hypothetical protein